MLDSSEPDSKSTLWHIIAPILIGLCVFFAIRLVAQSFVVVDISMEPNLHDGQFLLVSKTAYWFGSPQRGDIIVFHLPDNPSRIFVKRVIGLPTQTVEIQNGQVFINGDLIQEPEAIRRDNSNYGPKFIPPGQYFVLGDNRHLSSDSRSWGTVPEGNIIGKAWLSIWPLSEWGLAPNFSLEAGGP